MQSYMWVTWLKWTECPHHYLIIFDTRLIGITVHTHITLGLVAWSYLTLLRYNIVVVFAAVWCADEPTMYTQPLAHTITHRSSTFMLLL